MNEGDVQKEREVIPNTLSLRSPYAPVVPLQGEVSVANLLTLLDVSPDALIMVDQAGRIALVNSQVEVLFGYPRSELVGKQLEVLLPERFHAAHAVHRHRYPPSPPTPPIALRLDLHVRRTPATDFP